MIEQNQVSEPICQGSPQIIKVNSEGDSPKRTCVQFICIFVIVIIFYLCTLAMPNALQSQYITPCNLNSGTIEFANYETEFKLDTNPRALYIPDFIPAQLFLLVKATIFLKGQTILNSQENITFQFSMWEVSKENGTLVEIAQVYHPKNHSTIVECYENDIKVIECDSFTVAYIPQMSQNSAFIMVEIVSEQKSRLLYLQVLGITASKGYTNSLIAIRYTFMILSIISASWYAVKLYKLSSVHHVIEQKMILVLSILVIFFDDPLYAITVLAPNKITSIIGVIFLSNFLVFLLMFWMVVAHRMVHENGGIETKAIDCQKITISIILWVCMILSYSLLEINFYSDPSSTYEQLNTSVFLAFKVLTFVSASIILLHICVGYYNFWKNNQLKLLRYRIHGFFSFYFIFCFALFLFTGDYQLYQFNGTRILLAISILNLYVYYMQYLWAPSQDGIESQVTEAHIEMQAQQNQVYDQLDDDGLRISFHLDEGELNDYEKPVNHQKYDL